MKTTLLSLLLLCTCVLAAQSSTRSVTESIEKDGYSFSVKMDKQQAKQLLPIFKELSGMKLDVIGKAIHEMENDVTLSLNTRKGKLSVSHDAADEEGRSAALKMTDLIKKKLMITPPPPPPTPGF